MKPEKLTDTLSVTERRLQPEDDHYTRYEPAYFIDDHFFKKTIESIGGYVYNMSVGRIGSLVIFNGFTWLAVHGVDSYKSCDHWARKFEQAFLRCFAHSPVRARQLDASCTWSIEFNYGEEFRNASSAAFVQKAKELFGSDPNWRHTAGAESPNEGYQRFEYAGPGTGLETVRNPKETVQSAVLKLSQALATLAIT